MIVTNCLSYGTVLTMHYIDVILTTMASQITSLTVVYSTVYSDGDQRKHQSSASLAFVRGIHRGPVNSPHKVPVTRKMFPFDDVIMIITSHEVHWVYWETIQYNDVVLPLFLSKRYDDRLFFLMGIHILVQRHRYVERSHYQLYNGNHYTSLHIDSAHGFSNVTRLSLREH